MSFYIYETTVEKKGDVDMWTKLGRKVGEIKHNDIIMTDDGPIVVMRPKSVVPYRDEMITVDELYAQGKIEGIYPVESFINFGEHDSND